MKRFSLTILILAISFLNCESKSQNISVMTYNIRLDVASDGENAWPNRKDFLISQILFLSPDIIGIQEARPNQMTDLKNALKGYKTIGNGRDGDDMGEHSAIFYNAKRVKVEHDSTFWLSPTPNKVSKGWDAAYPRICTYGLFTLLESHQKIWVFNTHLDHVGTEAKLEGVKLILEKINDVNTDGFPVVFMGDFNAEPNSNLIKNLKQKMDDSKDMAKITFGSKGTFNGFKFEEPVIKRIDYIMVSKSNVEIEKYGALSSSVDLKYPSDHFPVLTELKLKE
ncbi:endonuclease/exonuclease/phosphatase family protein [Changchengzhania lutea]|uniref:endonuclease/exonuclease/phosphatase family protein n=1 Tax=Changchengzhania lutea TaxID=2049305 RepID=UPI00115D8277|nr:endonuclease/exonuclease/phosphatase family protein [Changchengzhania lutea]